MSYFCEGGFAALAVEMPMLSERESNIVRVWTSRASALRTRPTFMEMRGMSWVEGRAETARRREEEEGGGKRGRGMWSILFW